jgi:hypothetical protein
MRVMDLNRGGDRFFWQIGQSPLLDVNIKRRKNKADARTRLMWWSWLPEMMYLPVSWKSCVVVSKRPPYFASSRDTHYAEQASMMTFTCQDCQTGHLLVGFMQTPYANTGIIRCRGNDQGVHRGSDQVIHVL